MSQSTRRMAPVEGGSPVKRGITMMGSRPHRSMIIGMSILSAVSIQLDKDSTALWNDLIIGWRGAIFLA